MRVVLLADAAASVRAFMKALLDRPDLTFVEAADATDAILAVETYRPALIFVDADLPPSGGLELLTRMREHIDTPIIVLALAERAGAASAYFARGADELLLKPLDASRLVECVDAALGLPRAEGAGTSVRLSCAR